MSDKGFSRSRDDGRACCLGIVMLIVITLAGVVAGITEDTLHCCDLGRDTGFFFCAGESPPGNFCYKPDADEIIGGKK